MEKRFIKIGRAAELLVSIETLRKWEKTGSYYRIGRRNTFL